MSHDTDLQKAVLDEFNWEPSVTAGHIGVTANGGIVTLTGHVDSYAKKYAVEMAASRIKGVRGVAEEIKVRLPFDAGRTDEEIAAAAVDRLAWNTSVPKDSLRVHVENGWVTLTGQVDWWFQKAAAEHDIRPLHGVIGISNQVTVTPRIDTAHLSDDITHALHRSVYFDPETVRVHAQGGRVTLTGTVHSVHDRQVAGQTAWSAPGTTDVVNQLTVA